MVLKQVRCDTHEEDWDDVHHYVAYIHVRLQSIDISKGGRGRRAQDVHRDMSVRGYVCYAEQEKPHPSHESRLDHSRDQRRVLVTSHSVRVRWPEFRHIPKFLMRQLSKETQRGPTEFSQ